MNDPLSFDSIDLTAFSPQTFHHIVASPGIVHPSLEKALQANQKEEIDQHVQKLGAFWEKAYRQIGTLKESNRVEAHEALHIWSASLKKYGPQIASEIETAAARRFQDQADESSLSRFESEQHWYDAQQLLANAGFYDEPDPTEPEVFLWRLKPMLSKASFNIAQAARAGARVCEMIVKSRGVTVDVSTAAAGIYENSLANVTSAFRGLVVDILARGFDRSKPEKERSTALNAFEILAGATRERQEVRRYAPTSIELATGFYRASFFHTDPKNFALQAMSAMREVGFCSR